MRRAGQSGAAGSPERDPLARLLVRLRLAATDGAFESTAAGPDDPATPRRRLFGGLVAAQAAMAAARTVEGGRLHSLHAYFLRAGRAGVPIRFEVESRRDGRSFAARRVLALQRGAAIFELAASFTDLERGPEHEHEPLLGDVPEPEGLPDWEAIRSEETGEPPRLLDAIEVRVCRPEDDRPGARPPPRRMVWMRPRGPLPDDPRVHAAVLVYASDRTLLRTGARLHGALIGRLPASLDHALWLHRPPRFDDWILYASESPIAAGGRVFAIGRMLDRRGRRLATVTQEGVIAAPRGRPGS